MYRYNKRVRNMTHVMWFVIGITASIVIACILVTIKVNKDMEALGL